MSEHDDEEFISKSQVKREMLALQALGQRLCEIPDKLREQCELPDSLAESINEFRRIKSNSARKRQLQYIGKIMREISDDDLNRIESVLTGSDQHAALEKRRLHQLETLRDNLLENDQDVLDSLIRSNSDIDIQHVRQLIRQAGREAAQNKPPAASRKLFRYLRETLTEIPSA